MFFVTLAFLPALALADHHVAAPAYGYAPAPAYCRETETSVYAEVGTHNHKTGNTKGGGITVPLTSCLTGLD
jgi:hypothetical protein